MVIIDKDGGHFVPLWSDQSGTKCPQSMPISYLLLSIFRFLCNVILKNKII